MTEAMTSPTTDTTMDTAMPDVITRYLATSEAKDAHGTAECFTADGVVRDEGQTHRGRDEIRRWREASVSAWEYTTTITDQERGSAGDCRVAVRITGNFPGGEADLTFRFTLRDGLIATLDIG